MYSGFYLDVAESDLTKNEIITWPKKNPGDGSNQNQKWTIIHEFEMSSHFRIQTQIEGEEKLYLTVDDDSDNNVYDVGLKPMEPDNNNQIWKII